jgi:hypothetical protein
MVVIVACDIGIDGVGSGWESNFTSAGVKLVLNSGGAVASGVACKAVENLFNSLADEQTIESSLNAANAPINAHNDTPPEKEMGLLVPTYGGVSATDDFKDIMK